ncbi:MAG: DUF4388 domain-containing protein [Blastocatellia bacterium]|nr:DUF4388 domain-containing protein [Blastocatellia bacterium]
MQDSRFVVLTGHLDNYPISDLVGILRHQRKTGRLLIEYAKGPGVFYFQEGDLVDAQLNDLSGLQAICVALAQPSASFNFNPLIQPSRTSIERSLQRVVSELLGCWDESPLQIESIATDRTLPDLACLPATSDSPHSLEAGPLEPLALPAAVTQRPAGKEGRPVLVMAAAGLMMLGLSSVIAVTGGFKTVLESTRPTSLPTESKEQLATESIGQLPSNPETRKTSSVQGEVSKGRELASGFEPSHRQVGSASLNKRSETSSPGSSSKIPSATNSRSPNEDDKKSPEVMPSVQSVNVVMKIENGRVSQASIANHKAGMDGYEALALRIVRQRRYASKLTGEETVRISVTQLN